MTLSNQPERILIVDDDQDVAESLALVLQAEGFATECASEASAALASIARDPPLCVLLDINLPGMRGLELARRVRAQHGDSIILIAVTGQPIGDQEVENTFEIVDHYLVKPIEFERLLKVLRPA